MSDLSAYAQIDPLLPEGDTGVSRSPQPNTNPTKTNIKKRILNLLSERVSKAAQDSPLQGP